MSHAHGAVDMPWETLPNEEKMPKYVVEREIPGTGKLTPAEMKAISKKRVPCSARWVRKFSELKAM